MLADGLKKIWKYFVMRILPSTFAFRTFLAARQPAGYTSDRWPSSVITVASGSTDAPPFLYLPGTRRGGAGRG